MVKREKITSILSLMSSLPGAAFAQTDRGVQHKDPHLTSSINQAAYHICAAIAFQALQK